MAEFTGKNLVFIFIGSAGTATLTGDHRTASLTTATGLAKSTAGSDAWDTSLATVKSWSASWSGVMQSAGTALEDCLAEGVFGTVTIAPEGTAAAHRKYTGACFAMGAKPSFPYDNVCEFSVEFTGDGALTRGSY